MAIYKLTNTDGEETMLGPSAFDFWINDIDLEQETVDAIEMLDVGEFYRDGGGASPVWEVERVA